MFKTVNQGTYPTRGSKFSAYVDIFSNEDVTIGAGETKMIPLGIAIDLEFIKSSILKLQDCTAYRLNTSGQHSLVYSYRDISKEEAISAKYENFMSTHYLQLAIRSSLGKKGLILPNGIGVIDLDFDKEIQMIIHNPVTLKSIVKYLLSFGKHKSKWNLKTGWKIGQITLLEHKSNLFNIESDKVRTDGFGSTGK